MRRQRRLAWWAGGALAGALQAAAFLPAVFKAPGAWDALAVALAVGALVLLWHRAPRPGLAAWAGWGFGTAWLVAGTGWMYVSLHRYGGLPSWLSAGAVLALCAALSLYLALAGGLWARWRRRRWAADAALFAALWALAEVARALILTGFPWAAVGYALVDSPFSALAPWLGVYGMGLVLAWAVAALVLGLAMGQARRALPPLVAAGGLLAVLNLASGPDFFTRPHGRPLSVTLLQGNVPQDEKFVAQYQGEMLVWHAQQLVAAEGDLVMAPETAIPLLPSDLPEGFWAALLRQFHTTDRAALFGVPLGSFAQGYTNSVVGVSRETRGRPDGVYRYNKYHLVPFGEVIPWGFRWFVDMMNMPLGDFTRGPRGAPSFHVAGQWIAPNICYEDLFGEELAARFTAGGTPAPTILANVSNLAWFGEHVAIDQHLQIARLRSLEFQRPTLRATNTGATVVIDHQGAVTDALPYNTRGVLKAQVQGRTGLTPYARWAGPFSLWPLVGVCGLLIVLATRGRREEP